MITPGEHKKIVLSVLDDGVGVSPKDQTKLFKLFGCLSTTKKINTRGVGLGLAISRMITEEFGGSVALTSRPGLGSAFHACLELRKDHQKTALN